MQSRSRRGSARCSPITAQGMRKEAGITDVTVRRGCIMDAPLALWVHRGLRDEELNECKAGADAALLAAARSQHKE